MGAQFAATLVFQPEIRELLGLDPQLGLLPVLSFPLLGIASALALSSIPNDLSTNNLTYIRLNLGLLMWQVGSLAIWLVESAAVPLPQCWPLWIAKLCVAIPIIVTSSISLSSIRVEEALIQSQVPTAVRQPLPLLLLRLAYDDLTESLSLPNRKTAVSRYLGFSQLLTIAVGGSFAFSPRAPIPLAINPSDVNVSEIVSSANETLGLHLYRTGFGIELMFLLGTVQWILADAEDRGMAGEPISKILNVGTFLTTLMISGSTLVGVLSSTIDTNSVDADLLPNILAAGAIGSSVSLVYLARALFA